MLFILPFFKFTSIPSFLPPNYPLYHFPLHMYTSFTFHKYICTIKYTYYENIYLEQYFIVPEMHFWNGICYSRKTFSIITNHISIKVLKICWWLRSESLMLTWIRKWMNTLKGKKIIVKSFTLQLRSIIDEVSHEHTLKHSIIWKKTQNIVCYW